ncbi:MAG: hypothetical protein ACKO8Q_10620 [Bacteroidota bacterium]
MTTNKIWLLSLTLGAIWLCVRIAAGYINSFNYWESQPIGVLSNLLLLLIGIFGAIYFTYNQGPQIRRYADDFKLAAKTTLVYTVIVSISMFAYYTFSHEMEKEKERNKQELSDFLNNEANIERIKLENSALVNKTREEIYQEKIGTINEKTSLRNVLIFGGFAIFLAGIVYSIVVPWIFRTLLLKESNE